MGYVKAASSIFAALPPWWHLPLALCALIFGHTMAICAVVWPRSASPGIEFVRDIVIPAVFAVLACASVIGGVELLYAR